jgi:hypothetical protein
MEPQAQYQAPTITEVGGLHEVTLLTRKYYATVGDFIYPHHLVFNVSGVGGAH